MNKYELFSFQKEALLNCEGFLYNSELKNGLAVVPTAGGKSVIIAKLATKIKSEKTLFIVPSVELLEQNLSAMEREGLSVSVYSASMKRKEMGQLTIATMGSLYDKGKDFKNFGFKFVVADEAHFKLSFRSVGNKEGKFKEFIKELKPKKLLGLTATPFVLDKINGLSAVRSMYSMRESLFKNVIHITQVSEVIAHNRWSKIVYDIHPVNKLSLEVNTSGSEYSSESVALFLKENNVNNRVCKLLKKYTSQKTLTFVETVDVAKTIRDWYNGKVGVGRCEVISGDMDSKLRKAIIAEYKDVNSDLNHLINYGTLTTGFDFPQLSIIIGARPTMSLSLYYQMLGRLTRVHPNKEFGLYIDLVGNYSNFGAIEEYNFENINGWKLFCGERLITDIPLTTPFEVTKSTLRNPPKLKKIEDINMKFWFGKYKEKEVRFAPKFYRDYLLKSMTPSTEKELNLIGLMLDLEEQEFIKILHK